MKIIQYFRLNAIPLLVAGLTCSTLAGAFTVYSFDLPVVGITLHADGNHEGITQKSLTSDFSTIIAGQEFSFIGVAAEIIADNNREKDMLKWNDPVVHFDDDTFVEATNHLAYLKNSIVRMAIAKNYYDAQMDNSTFVPVSEFFPSSV